MLVARMANTADKRKGLTKMVADLEIVDGKASMMYAANGGTPWHGLGTAVPDAVTSAEAMEIAGLGWKVKTENVFDARGNAVPRYIAVTRDTDEKILGVVGAGYVPIQNADAFGFMDSLFADRSLLYDTAGALNGGSTIWMLARMASDMRVMDDVYAQFLLAATSHDASRALSIYATSVRVVCANTLIMATKARAAVNIRHTGDIGDKMNKARAVLQATTDEQRRYQEWLQKLSEAQVSEKTVTNIQEKLFGGLDEATPTQRKNAIESFLAIYKEEAERVGATGYALANAVTGYADHKIRVTKDSNKLISSLTGRSAMFKKQGLVAIAAATRVPMKI